MNKKSLSIEWHSVLRDLLRNIWVILCAMLVGVLGSYIVTHSVYQPEYTSHATLIVNSAAGKANAIASLSQSSEIASIYAEVFVQPSMEKKVCEELNMKEFDGKIKTHVNAGTNIMELSVTASNPEEAYLELQAILKVYPQITSSLYSNGVVSVLRPAEMPMAPSNSMTSASVVKIALIAMLVAALPIVLLSVLRDTVKNKDDFDRKIESKLIGSIPHEKKPMMVKDFLRGKKQGILINESAFISLKFNEGINQIAGKLDYMRRTNGDKVFAVTSISENEGKSTVASNIALSLATKGYKVVLLDFDGKKPAIYKIFGQDPEECSEFGDALSGIIPLKDYKFTRFKRTSLFLALNTKAHKNYQKWFEDGTAEKILNGLRNTTDFVILDTAPMSVDGSVTDVAGFSDAVMLVVRTDRVYASVINDGILVLNKTGSRFAGCVLNDVYEDFSFFNQFGADESGYAHGAGYSKYGKYSKYSKYSKYAKYADYTERSRGEKQGKHGKYGKGADGKALQEVEAASEKGSEITNEEKKDGGSI